MGSDAALAVQKKVLNLQEIFTTISINAKPASAMSLTALYCFLPKFHIYLSAVGDSAHTGLALSVTTQMLTWPCLRLTT
jgi:hypothetical protein